MSNRRQFIQAGMAVTAAAMDSSLAGSTEPESIRAASVLNSAFYKVIYDAAFPAAVSFAAEAQRLGATTQSIRGDVTDLWYHDLSRRWTHSAIAIAGMTTYESMFVLGLMARDARMRFVYQATHRLLPDGTVEHHCYAPTTVHGRCSMHEGEYWERAAARLIMGWQAERIQVEDKTMLAAASERMIDAQTLLSWIIAPVRTAHRTERLSARRLLLNGNNS
jgi:hypothetical protein